MVNKDGEIVYNSLNNRELQLYIGGGEWVDNLKSFDYLDREELGPDLIGIGTDKIYGIEHFYADASHQNKKGNALKIEYFKNIKKEIIPEIEKNLEEDNISTKNYKFKSKLSYDNLKKNIYSNFEKHYEKINSYNTNIKDKYGVKKEIEIIFFIELSNVLSSVYLINGKPEKYISPFNDISFLKYFSDKKNIKGIIFNTNHKNYYIPIKDKYIVDNINIFDFSNGEIGDFEMNQITSCIKINS